jgi:GNAT superfamily N-acetyltransferase
MIKIRPHAAPDTAALLALILGIQCGEFGLSIGREDQPDLLDVAGFYRRGILGGRRRRRHRRFGGVDRHRRGRMALRKMFVAPAQRGDGLAARLLDVALAHARAHGAREVLLGTTEAFLAAHRFYEKHGFACVERAALPAAFPVMAVDTRFYRLALASPSLLA